MKRDAVLKWIGWPCTAPSESAWLVMAVAALVALSNGCSAKQRVFEDGNAGAAGATGGDNGWSATGGRDDGTSGGTESGGHEQTETGGTESDGHTQTDTGGALSGSGGDDADSGGRDSGSDGGRPVTGGSDAGSGDHTGAGDSGTGPGSGDGDAGAAGTGGSEAVCSSGQVRCDELVPQQCSELGQWVSTGASCAVDCLNGECVECTEGAPRCKDGAVQQCVAGSWTAVELCDNACENGTCVAACTEGLYQCNGDRVLQQCVGGEYVDDTECEFLCSGAECTGECVPDDRRCNPDADNESQACNAQGLWDESAPCGSGTFCVAGDCRPCSPGKKRCSGSVPQLCSDAGEWVNQGACASPRAACFEGACVPCTPDEKRCSENAVEQCLADGSDWELLETCSGDTPVCLQSTEACGKCLEDDTQCYTNKVQTCDDTGNWQTTETCSGSTPRCVDDACAECDPDAKERRCRTQSSFQVCDADGSWGSETSCSGDTPLCRDDLNFACGCEENQRRCRNSTVPEVCQGGAWVAQSACTGTLDYCLPETGHCVDCKPDATECQDGAAHQCNSEGSWESLNSCAGPNINCGGCNLGEDCGQNSDCTSGYCVNGKCAVCQPTARECSGDMPRVCSSSGTWTDQSLCAEPTPKCLPSTGQCVQCLTSAMRTGCGSCNSGTQTCGSNNLWGSCVDAIDLETDHDHCGSCTTQCGTSQSCCSSSCVNLQTSSSHCGECNKACGSSQYCSSGNCVACGSSGQACCSGACGSGLICSSNVCIACGSSGQPCCSGGACGGGLTCNSSNVCTACGGYNQLCCPGTSCNSSLACIGTTCTCASGSHWCSTGSCKSDTDVSNCGPGPSCFSCVQANAIAACGNNKCNNSCPSGGIIELCPAGTDGKVNCGLWDFETGTDGWAYTTPPLPTLEPAYIGALTSSTSTWQSGGHSLAISYDSTSISSPTADVRIPLCASVNMTNLVMSAWVRFVAAAGSPKLNAANGINGVVWYSTDSVRATAGSGFFPNPDTGGGEYAGSWMHLQVDAGDFIFYPDVPPAVTHIGFHFGVGNWKGTIYMDNIQIQ
ncbi:MAG: hypothetical protein JW940_34370 [Polyangiaceae bacterium]|nr:hypothetical protein [Polyangiaceae bacterium]